MPAADCTPYAEDDPMPCDADVIQINRFADRHPGTERPEPAANTAAETGTDPVMDLIGEQVQALFTANGRTLTDPATADGHRISMDGVIGLIDGALAQGIIGPEQHSMLRTAFEGMRNVPETL